MAEQKREEEEGVDTQGSRKNWGEKRESETKEEEGAKSKAKAAAAASLPSSSSWSLAAGRFFLVG